MKHIQILIVVLLTSTTLAAQPFIDEILAFKKQDSISFPTKGETLFVGSSSFRLWKDMQQYFPKHAIINRGFGGSSLEDVIRYADQIIFPYAPKQIVIYGGENDIAGGITPEKVSERFTNLVTIIRNKLPDSRLIYVAAKPSPSREKFQPAMIAANNRIKDQISRLNNAVFVDIYSLMLTADGKMRPELFGQDMLHMNSKGYEIWAQAIEAVLD
jgi:lysophospholipase L1-like esterase